ncbi:MAG: phage Gp37/Gp68 family protein [Candidatus Marinimicrobia bacterium]|nr:phage Gp37/Gp68 family protein [Candidatus Neomarinimicrobiota bacterium]
MKKFTKAKGGTKIEWAEKSWNPSVGCFKISDGCKNCYAEKMHKRHLGNPKQPKYIKPFNEVVTWSNDLETPFKWKKSMVVFVCSMSDLFHKDVPTDFIKSVFHTMNTSHHQYRVLTKRSKRLKELSSELKWTPNIWAGVTVESAKHNNRIDDLRSVPAQARYISFEPLIDDLGNIDLSNINWVIVGGESGSSVKSLRTMKYKWVANIRDKCLAEEIPFFFKQWGKKEFNPDPSDPTIPNKDDPDDEHSPKGGHLIDGEEYSQVPEFIEYWGVEIEPSVKAEIDALDKNIHKSKDEFTQAWINIGQSLTLIKRIADESGDGRQFWQTYLGVDSFQDYCQKKLRFSRETATQMRQSFQVIRDLRPELLEGDVNEIPSYTKVRALHPHLDEITANPVKFAPVIDITFDSSKHRSAINKAVREAFPDDSQTATAEVDWNKYLGGVELKISRILEPGKQDRLKGLIGELRDLLD